MLASPEGTTGGEDDMKTIRLLMLAGAVRMALPPSAGAQRRPAGVIDGVPTEAACREYGYVLQPDAVTVTGSRLGRPRAPMPPLMLPPPPVGLPVAPNTVPAHVPPPPPPPVEPAPPPPPPLMVPPVPQRVEVPPNTAPQYVSPVPGWPRPDTAK